MNDNNNNVRIFFSIVIPLFNKEKFIHRTIDSVLSQSYPFFEIIVIDDGSTDNSSAIVEKIIDDRIRLIKQANKGVSAARNKGIIEAKSEFIAFIDGDDWWHKDFLKEISSLINVFPNHDLYASKFAFVRKNKVVLQINKGFPNSEKFSFNLFKVGLKHRQAGLPINSSNIVLKRSAILNCGCFDERIRFFEDYDLFLRMAYSSEIAYVNNIPLSFYNQDLNDEERATGKLPDFNYNMFNYTEKHKMNIDNNLLYQKYFIKLFAIYNFDYWIDSHNHNRINKLIKYLKISKFPIKYRILYTLPSNCSKTIILNYRGLKKTIVNLFN